MSPRKEKPADWRDSPTAWFARLERAAAERDEAAARQAERELRRLGYDVRREAAR
jgi:hypothetical protein